MKTHILVSSPENAFNPLWPLCISWVCQQPALMKRFHVLCWIFNIVFPNSSLGRIKLKIRDVDILKLVCLLTTVNIYPGFNIYLFSYLKNVAEDVGEPKCEWEYPTFHRTYMLIWSQCTSQLTVHLYWAWNLLCQWMWASKAIWKAIRMNCKKSESGPIFS